MTCLILIDFPNIALWSGMPVEKIVMFFITFCRDGRVTSCLIEWVFYSGMTCTFWIWNVRSSTLGIDLISSILLLVIFNPRSLLYKLHHQGFKRWWGLWAGGPYIWSLNGPFKMVLTSMLLRKDDVHFLITPGWLAADHVIICCAWNLLSSSIKWCFWWNDVQDLPAQLHSWHDVLIGCAEGQSENWSQFGWRWPHGNWQISECHPQ